MGWVLSLWSHQSAWIMAEAPSGVDLSIFAQYGVLGVFVVILILYARISYRREIDRADRLEQEVTRLHELRQQDYEKTAAALAAASEAMRKSTELMADLRMEGELRRRGEESRRRPSPGTRG